MMMNAVLLILIILYFHLNNVHSETTKPTKNPTTKPTRKPTPSPTRSPTYVANSPTPQPSLAPTKKPSPSPTRFPSTIPTVAPTYIPGKPTPRPSKRPTPIPSSFPSARPSTRPSARPSTRPSTRPSARPTTPSSRPSSQPTNPTSQPSSQPTSPTSQPSSQPTSPTGQPSRQPSQLPSSQPSSQPSNPTSQPSSQPTNPTGQPSSQPSSQPTNRPSSRPTTPSGQPTSLPSQIPTSQPSRLPSTQPTSRPTSRPSVPTSQPTRQPSRQPSSQPSMSPTSQPSSKPTHEATPSPTAVIPIMRFTSTISLTGLASSTLDESSQVAIIESAAKSMNIESSAISMDQFNTYQASLTLSSLTIFTSSNLLTITYSAQVTLLTSLSLVSYPYSSPQDYYNALTLQLTTSVSSGTFTTYLNQFAPSSSAVYGAIATGVTNSGYTLAGVDTSTDSSKQSIDIKAIAGAVVGAVVAFAVIVLLIRKKYITFSCLKRQSRTPYTNMNGPNTKPGQRDVHDDVVEIGYNRSNDWQDWSSDIETREEGISPFADKTKNSSNNFGKTNNGNTKKNPVVPENNRNDDHFELQSHRPLGASIKSSNVQNSSQPKANQPFKTSQEADLFSFSGKSIIELDPHQHISTDSYSNDVFNSFSNGNGPTVQKSDDGWNTFVLSDDLNAKQQQQQEQQQHDQFEVSNTFNTFSNIQAVQNSADSWNTFGQQHVTYSNQRDFTFPQQSIQPQQSNASTDLFTSFPQQPIQPQQSNASPDLFTSFPQQPIQPQQSNASTDLFTSFPQQPIQQQQSNASPDLFTSFPQQSIQPQQSNASPDLFTSFPQQSVPSSNAPTNIFNEQQISSNPFTSGVNLSRSSLQQQPTSQPQTDLFHKFIQTAELPKAPTQQRQKPTNPFENIHALIPPKKDKN